MKNRNDLIVKLDKLLKQNLTNANLSKAINMELLQKNINQNLTGALFNGYKDIIDLTDNELILITKVFFNYFKAEELNPSLYFNERTLINYATNIKSPEDKIELMEFNNVIHIDDTSYIAFIGAEKLYNYFINNLFVYDKEAQRQPKLRLLGKNYLIKQISVNKSAVKEIEKEMINNTYESDMIIFNVLMLEGKNPNIKYNNGNLIIKPNLDIEAEDTTIVQIIDGYHRLSALVNAVAKLKKEKKIIPSNMGLIAKIVVRDIQGARKIVVQSFKRSATSEDFLKSLEVSDYTKLANALQEKIYLQEKICLQEKKSLQEKICLQEKKSLQEKICLQEKIFDTYEECVFCKGISYKTLIADVLEKILPIGKNFLYNLNVVNKMADAWEKIINYIIEEYFSSLEECIQSSNLLKINSVIYWLVFTYNITQEKINEEKFIDIGEKILLSSATWDDGNLQKKKINVKEKIKEAEEIYREEII